MSAVVHLDAAKHLAEGAKLYRFWRPNGTEVLWRRRLHAMHSGLGRDCVVELTNELVLRVFDPRTGETLAQSKPGQIDTVDWSAARG